MDDRWMRVQGLPGGECRDSQEAGWAGAILHIEYVEPGTGPDLEPGTPVQVESQLKVYLGVVEETGPTGVSVSVEHSLDRGDIELIHEVWG